MSSEFNHIDNFFRKKEEESAASSANQEQHWQQMKNILTTSAPSSQTNTIHRFRNFGWLVAALLILAVGIWMLTKEVPNASKTNTAARMNVSDSLPMRDTFLLFRSIEPGKTDTVKFKIPAKVLPVPIRPVPLRNNTLKVLQIPPVLISNQEAYHSFFQTLEKPFETFMIDNEKDTTIICKEGTIIKIPARTFASLTASSSSQVTFRVREFYEIADIVAHKLTTSSFSEPLVTGGMIYMEALLNSEPVKMSSGSSIKISMPTEKFDSEMQLFTGTTGTQLVVPETTYIERSTDTALLGRGVNWLAMGQMQSFYEASLKIVQVLDLTNSPKKVTGKRNQSVAHFKIPYAAPGSEIEIKKQLEERYGGQYKEIKVKRQHKPIRIGRFYTGKSYQRNESDPFVGDTISMPLYLASRLKLINSRDSIRFEENYLKMVETQVKLQQAYSKDYNQRKQYNFSITSLGWINCDKFLNSKQQIPFMVNTGKGFEDTYFESFLIFRDFNGIMGGSWQNGKITFKNIPVGQRVSAVCIGIKDGKAFYAIRDFQVTNEEVSLEMMETTPEAFRDQLKRFGTVKGG